MRSRPGSSISSCPYWMPGTRLAPASPPATASAWPTRLLESIRKVLRSFPGFSARGTSGYLLGFIGSEPSQHEVDHAHLHSGVTRGRQPLIVLAVPPISSQPGEGALDHPAPIAPDE